MIPPLALAGPAEAAALFSYGIHAAGLLIAALMLRVSWKRRGWRSAALALGLLCFVGMLLEVRDVFSHVSASDDPDALHWDRVWRALCIAWIALAAFGVACLVRAFMPRRSPDETDAGRAASPPTA